MKKIKVYTLQGKWTGDFESNNKWYKDEALKLYEQVKADYPEYLRFNNLDNFIERVK